MNFNFSSFNKARGAAVLCMQSRPRPLEDRNDGALMIGVMLEGCYRRWIIMTCRSARLLKELWWCWWSCKYSSSAASLPTHNFIFSAFLDILKRLWEWSRTMHTSWTQLKFPTVKSSLSIFPPSCTKCFQSVVTFHRFYNQLASFMDQETGSTRAWSDCSKLLQV